MPILSNDMIDFKQHWLSLVCFFGVIASPFADVHIYFFDVGQGNCILLRNEKNAILVDAGSGNTTFENISDSFKKCLGGIKINGIVLTHLDSDHINFVKDITESKEFTAPGSLIYSTRTNSKGPSIVCGPAISSLQKVQGTYEEGINTIQVYLNGLFGSESFTFLKANWSSFLQKSDTNATCLVFSFKYHGCKVLFTGDSTGRALDKYIEQEEGVSWWKENRDVIANTNIFVMPHHGSEEDGAWRWTLNVTKYSPNLIATIINVDATKTLYNHPRAWITDVTWPDSMQSVGFANLFSYNRGRGQTLQAQIAENLFTTGDHEEGVNFIEIIIKEEDSSINIMRDKREIPLGIPIRPPSAMRHSTVLPKKRARKDTTSDMPPSYSESTF